jgi:hypothetical protein
MGRAGDIIEIFYSERCPDPSSNPVVQLAGTWAVPRFLVFIDSITVRRDL